MYSLLVLALTSFVLSLVLTALFRNVFLRFGLVDKPDNIRKLHKDPIPRVGGLPIAISYLGAYAVLILLSTQGSVLIREHLDLAWRLFPAAGLIFVTGLLDDLFGLKPWQKLIGQLAGASWACWAGVSITRAAGHSVESWFGVPLTILWLIGCTNAFNLIDGMDGLASGVGFFGTITILLAALLQNNLPLALATVPLAGALLGFLRYNFNPASIFLGDSGSLLIGFLLGCFGVIWSQKSATLLGMTAPLMVLALPMMDAGLSILRRLLRHQPIFSADRGHIHHRLLNRGLSPRKATLLLYAICGMGAAFSLIQSVADNHVAGLVIVLFCVGAWIGIQNLGYVEFGVTREMLVGGGFRRMLSAHIHLRQFEESLLAAKELNHCWEAIQDAGKIFGFDRVQLKVASRDYYKEYADSTNSNECWTVRIALPNSSWVNLTRAYQCPVLPMAVSPFIDTLSSLLKEKIVELELIHSRTLEMTAPVRHKSVPMSSVAGRFSPLVEGQSVLSAQ